MLVLSRKVEQEIIIDSTILVKVLSIGRGRVKLGISAPKRVAIARREISHLPAETDGQGRLATSASLREPPGTGPTRKAS